MHSLPTFLTLFLLVLPSIYAFPSTHGDTHQHHHRAVVARRSTGMHMRSRRTSGRCQALSSSASILSASSSVVSTASATASVTTSSSKVEETSTTKTKTKTSTTSTEPKTSTWTTEWETSTSSTEWKTSTSTEKEKTSTSTEVPTTTKKTTYTTHTTTHKTTTYTPPTTPKTTTTKAAPTTSTEQAETTTTSSSSNGYYAGVNTGSLTYYNTGLDACGFTDSDSSSYIAAMSLAIFNNYPGYDGTDSNNNPICNKQVKVTWQGKSTTVRVVDACVGCSTTQLDLSPLAFQALADLSVGELDGATWEWV
uniref:RlpA-like protein double-psi beta-barrel domain-containing protein n=1 Tax=Mycena chlorophos TaxID=658473 RepID=A0ABQ0KXC4_MYCCL|nr:predicted protein [Mycena chlorophos]